MRRAVFWFLGLGTVGGGLAAANFRHDSRAPAVDWQLFRPAPPRVVVARPTRGPIARAVAAKGVVEAVRQVAVVAKVGGRVAEVLVAEGAAVGADQPLIRLDEAPFRKRLDAAQTRLDAATKNLAIAEAHLKDIEKDPAAATTPATPAAPAPAPTPAANPALTNLAALRGAGAGALPAATAPAAPAGPSKLAAARDSVDGWDRERKAAEVARDAARTDLDRATVRAPFAGVVEDLNVAVGDDVLPRPAVAPPTRAEPAVGSGGPLAGLGGAMGGDTAGPDLGGMTDRPLCVILDPDQLRVRAWVDEADVGLISAGQPARVFLPDEPTEAVGGRISRVAPRGRPNGEVVAFAAVVAFDDVPRRARVGMRVNIEVEVARRADPLGVPVQAVLHRRRRDLAGSVALGPESATDRDGYVRAVFVLDGDRARLRPIETGLSDERRVEVAGGLAESDEVIVGPFRSLDALDEGTVVAVETDEATPATGPTPRAEEAPPNGFGPPR